MTPSPRIWRRPAIFFRCARATAACLVRAGQTEGSVDLARLAGLKPAGVICEIMKDDGTMARQPDLMRFAKKHKLKVVTIADLIQHRLNYDSLVYQSRIGAAADPRRRRCFKPSSTTPMSTKASTWR